MTQAEVVVKARRVLSEEQKAKAKARRQARKAKRQMAEELKEAA